MTRRRAKTTSKRQHKQKTAYIIIIFIVYNCRRWLAWLIRIQITHCPTITLNIQCNSIHMNCPKRFRFGQIRTIRLRLGVDWVKSNRCSKSVPSKITAIIQLESQKSDSLLFIHNRQQIVNQRALYPLYLHRKKNPMCVEEDILVYTILDYQRHRTLYHHHISWNT